jgi:hypothetical protein
MAMKPIAVFIVVAALAVVPLAAGAKTVTSSQGNANDTSVAAVAGPTAAANASHRVPDNRMAGKMTAPADKKAKAKIKTAQENPPPKSD